MKNLAKLLVALLSFVLLSSCADKDPPQRTALDYATATTNNEGRVRITLTGAQTGSDPLEFNVQLEDQGTGAPLQNISVFALADDTNVLVMAKDPRGNYVMEWAELTREELQAAASNGERDFGVSGVIGGILLTMAVWDYVTSVVAVERQEAEVLWRTGNYTVACLSRGEFNQQVELGASFVLLTANLATAGTSEATGLLDDAVDAVWQVAESVAR